MGGTTGIHESKCACVCIHARPCAECKCRGSRCVLQSGCTRRATTEHSAEIMHQLRQGLGAPRSSTTRRRRTCRARTSARLERGSSKVSPAEVKRLRLAYMRRNGGNQPRRQRGFARKITWLRVIGGGRLDEAVLKKCLFNQQRKVISPEW